jgi:hypothetical protein
MYQKDMVSQLRWIGDPSEVRNCDIVSISTIRTQRRRFAAPKVGNERFPGLYREAVGNALY